MRNLKKFLALVLALMMIVSVMVTVNAASATTDDYDDAVETLELYDVLKGNPDGDLHVKDSISRAEMAAIVYRVLTGDTTSSDQDVNKQFGDYVDKYGFTDVSKTYWARGYIGWCANAGILKGNGDNTVAPTLHITGYEVRAMLLRAMGYDKNKEFTGGNWQYNVLSFATKAGINTGVTLDPALETPRGAVAQLTYNAACDNSCVYYDASSKSYEPTGYPLIWEGTDVDGDPDTWGAPTKSRAIEFTWPNTAIARTVTIKVEAKDEFWGTKTECDIAVKVGITTSKTYNTYINGKNNVTTGTGKVPESNDAGKVVIEPKDMVGTVGALGRWTRVYDDRIVYVDTFLAVVTDVTAAVTDAGGHTIRPASATATVYGNTNAKTTPGTIYAATLTGVTITGSYAKGDVLGVQIATAANNTLATGAAVKSASKLTSATITVNAITKNTDGTNTVNGFIGTNGVTYTYNDTFGYNAIKNPIDDTAITDGSIGDAIVVYTDAKGYVLGVKPAPTSVDYGVITDAYAKQIGDGKYVVEAKVLTASGSTATLQTVYTTTHATGEPWGKVTDAETALPDAAPVNTLVKVGVDPKNSAYYTLTKTTVTPVTKTQVWAGQAATLTAADTTAPSNTAPELNDDTVFFIAKYQLNNKSGTYDPKGYDIKTGFQNIPDLAMKSGGGVTITGETGTKNNLSITWFDTDADNTDAEYALILYGVESSPNTEEAVPAYTFLPDPTKFSTTYDSYIEYNAFVNGSATKIKVAYVEGDKPDATGLYVFSEPNSTNGAYGKVKKIEYKVTGNTVKTMDNYEYADGVLDVKNGLTVNSVKKADGKTADDGSRTNRHYFTVAKGAAAYIVNTTKGTISSARYDLDTLLKYKVYGACDIYFQLDKYGWIDVIYIVDDGADDPASDSGDLELALTSASGTFGSDKITLIGCSVTGSGTYEDAATSITATIKRWNGTAWEAWGTAKADSVKAASGGENITALTASARLGSGDYQVTITVTATGTAGTPVTKTASATFTVADPS